MSEGDAALRYGMMRWSFPGDPRFHNRSDAKSYEAASKSSVLFRVNDKHNKTKQGAPGPAQNESSSDMEFQNQHHCQQYNGYSIRRKQQRRNQQQVIHAAKLRPALALATG
jgi:hypothetical protein